MASPPQESPPKPPQLPRTIWIWWLVLLVLMVWNIVSFWPKSRPEVNIPYTTFLAQVRADNVAGVRIVGDRISGSFVKPLQWPQADASAPTSPPSTTTAAPSGAQAPSSPGKQAPPASADKQAAPPPAVYQDFTTTFPQALGDPSLLPLLESHRVAVAVSSPPTHWLMLLLTEGLPIVFLVAFFLLAGRQAARGQSGLFGFGRSKARRYTHDHPEVTFADVAGAGEAKLELLEEVDFLRHPQKYHDLGARIPRGVLLVGSPGTGKTLLARAVAGEAGVPFFSISASEFVEMFVGVGASRVRDLFVQAKGAAPSIVFIDELDAVGRRRGAGVGATNDEREQTLNQLLVEMDGFDERQEVIVMAATNRPDVLDPALLRPGRFDRQVMVSIPDREGREGILRIHTQKLRLAPDVNLVFMARSTTGFSGPLSPISVTRQP